MLAAPRTIVRFVAAVLLLLPSWALVFAEDVVPLTPGAVLMDFTTGRLLFQKNPDWVVPPASLTKLMTLHLAWKALESGSVHPGDTVELLKEVLDTVPPDSSLMFLEPGQVVTVSELMLGLAVDSGNDAGLVLASFLGGSEASFVQKMNQEAAALGLTHTSFHDSFGYSPENVTTALDLARFCRVYLQTHTQAIALIHNVKTLAYPLQANARPGDKRKIRTIVQTNRNTLLETYPGADGLKTGFINESGYNLAATAMRGHQRLIAVLLGIHGRDTNEGSRIRGEQAARLLDFGFENYPLAPLPVPVTPPVRVWYSDEGFVDVVPAGQPEYPLSAEEALLVKAKADIAPAFVGPFAAGTTLGKIVWSREGKVFYSQPLVAQRALKPAPWWKGLQDAVVLFFQGLFGAKAPIKPAPLSQ